MNVKMTFGADGRFSFEADGVLKEGFLEEDEEEPADGEGGEDDLFGDENPFAGLLDGDLDLTMFAQGTWDTDEGQIMGVTEESELTLDGKEPDVFFEELFRAAAEGLADELELEGLERTAFIELVVLGAAEEFGEEERNEEIFADVLDGTYLLDGDTLIITDFEDEVFEWSRTPVSSAVAPASWGLVKARHGRP